MMYPVRVGVRTRLLLAAVGAVAIALAIGVTAFNLFLSQRLTASAVSLARAQAAAKASSLEVLDGRLVSPEGKNRGTQVASPVWVFGRSAILERPRVSSSLTAIASSLAGGPERTLRVDESIRLYALPVTHNGRRLGTVVAGVLLAPYGETATIAFVGSIALAIALLVAVAFLSHWILGKALLPVSRMTDDAAAWSDHDLDRRFNRGEPYDELTQLAATLDAMLERLSAGLRHEQSFTAELSHELRTPLAKIAAETELALRRERTTDDYRASLGAVRRSAEQMTRTVEALLSAARQEAGLTRATSDVRNGIEVAVAAVREDAMAAGIEVRLSLPQSPVPVAIEVDLLERIVHPLLDNALRYGRAQVTVALRTNGSAAFVDVEDDGAGIAEGEIDTIFEPGVRGTAAAADPRGAGLGLVLARRLARSAGGEIVATAGETGGLFSVRLPLA